MRLRHSFRTDKTDVGGASLSPGLYRVFKLNNSDIQTIKRSNLFDPVFYLKNNLDVRNSRMDPLVHFCRYGHLENRDPNENFSISRYREENPTCGQLNPLIHFIVKSKTQNSSPANNTRFFSRPAQSVPAIIGKTKTAPVQTPRTPEEKTRYLRQGLHPKYKKVSKPVAIITTKGLCPELTIPFIRHLTSKSIPVVLIWTGDHNPPDSFSEAKVVFYREKPFNYGRAMNLGVSSSEGDLFLFLNDDLKVCQDDWIEQWLKTFDDLTVALSSPTILNPDGSIQRFGTQSTLDSPQAAFVVVTQRQNTITDTGTPGGPCLAVRSEAFSGFDESLILYCSDDEIGLKMSRCVVTPDSEIVHYQGTTCRTTSASTTEDVQTFWKNNWKRILEELPKPSGILTHYPLVILSENIQHILIVKIDHIGDIVLAKEGMLELKQRFPEAKITVLCGSWAIPFLNSLGFENCLPFDLMTEGGSAARTQPVPAEQLDAVRKLCPDIAYNFRGDDQGLEGVFASNPSLSVSFSPRTDVQVQTSPTKSMKRSFLELSRAVPSVSFKSLREPKGNAVGIHPFASVPNKQIRLDIVVDLIRYLKERQIPVVLFGPENRHAEMKKWNTPIAPAVPIDRYLDSVFDHCCVYVGMDSGPTHIVSDAGMPTVDIIGGINPVPFCLAQGPFTVGIGHPVECSPCYQSSVCSRHQHCINISPKDILWGIGEVLGMYRKAKRV